MNRPASRPSGSKRSFRRWRRSRPFWGGVLTLLAAIELYGLTAAPVSLMAVQGMAYASALMISLMLVVLAISTWVQPNLRIITGWAVIILSIGSLLLVNLGGFLLGMFLGVIGGGLIFAWTPNESPAAPVPGADAATGYPGSEFAGGPGAGVEPGAEQGADPGAVQGHPDAGPETGPQGSAGPEQGTTRQQGTAGAGAAGTPATPVTARDGGLGDDLGMA